MREFAFSALILSGLFLLCFAPSTRAQDAILVLSPAPVLTTLAGAGAGTSGFRSPSAVTYDAAGNLYVCDTAHHRVQRISAGGTSTIVAGNGTQDFAGDNGPALAASLDSPLGVALATDGTLYIADTHNHRVRRVTADGTIQTIAGNGTGGFDGDKGPAIDAELRSPSAIAVGSLGELYVADTGNHRVRRIALDGTIQTVAGNGREEAFGDGGPATSAGLDAPSSVVFRASDGALLIADRLNSRIRVVAQSGIITSLSAAVAPVRRAAGVALDLQGNTYIADSGNYRLRAVLGQGSGILLGSGEQGLSNNTAAYNATPLGTTFGIAADTAGGVSFSDRDQGLVQHLALPVVEFAPTLVGQSSPIQMLSLQNSGTESLAVQSIDVPPTFSVTGTGTCGVTPFILVGGAGCRLALAYAPTIVGAQSGMLSVVTAGLPQRAVLSGVGLASGTLLASSTTLQSDGTLSFVGSPVTFTTRVLPSGTTAATGVVHLLDAAREIAAGPVDAQGTAVFTTSALAVGQHSLSAQYEGDVHYRASASAALQQTVALAPDFVLTAASSQTSVAAGGTASMEFTLQPINGTLNRTITLDVSGVPAGAVSSSNAPVPLVLASNAVTITVLVKTLAPALLPVRASLLCTLFALPGVVRLRRASPHRRRTPAARLVAFVALTFPALFAVGCGGGYLGGATTSAQNVAHTYPITVTATTTGVTGSTLVHTASVTLVVN